MNQWEIWGFPVPSDDSPHGCVILSPNQVASNPSFTDVNVLVCTTLRPDTRIRNYYFQLDQSDGVELRTVVNCSMVYRVNKKHAIRKRGMVGVVRQAALLRAFIRILSAH